MASAEFQNPLSDFGRTLALIDAADSRIRRRFIQLIGRARGIRTLEEIERLLVEGRIFEALAVMDDVSAGLNEAITAAYLSAGASVAEALSQQSGLILTFDQLNTRGVFALQAEASRRIRQLSSQAQEAINLVLQDGVRRGLAPQEIARNVRGSIGLTGAQVQWVSNYRENLRNLSPLALQRQLRDRRFDGTIARAIEQGDALSASQIESMVSRYEERMLNYRASVIGQSEAVQAVNMGEFEMWEQARDRGAIFEQQWHVVLDGRQRDSHGPMNGQTQPMGQPFVSGAGALLRFPGDPSASVAETAFCRCAVTRQLLALPQ